MFSLPLKGLLQKQLLCRKLIFSMAILHLWSNNTNEEIHFLAKFQVHSQQFYQIHTLLHIDIFKRF